MPSAQDYARRLREQAYRTLAPQIRDLEQEMQNTRSALSSGLQQIERKLDALRNIELPTAEVVLDEIFHEIRLQKEKETSSLALFAQSLRQKETQEEILGLLLDNVAVFFPRTALFAVRGDRLVGWSSRGFPEAQAQIISRSSFLRSDCEPLESALNSNAPIPLPDVPEGQGPIGLLRENPAEVWYSMLLRVLQRPVALLLASGTNGVPSSTNALCVLATLASFRLENLALKILHELAAAEVEVPARPAREDLAATSAASAAQEPAPGIAVPEQVSAHPAEQVAADIPKPAPEELAEIPSAAPAPAVEREERMAAPAPAINETVPASAPVPRPTEIQFQEPSPVMDEEKLHADAKRFARLLVSEIKLYNEHHVIEGRQNRDLYIRLKRDIDRSREMYEKRVSPIVARKVDYFHDEIVRILGDNDPYTLGSDYPGPRVEN